MPILELYRLPVANFSQKDLADILFPSLISCCFQNYDNTALLVSEFNPILVAYYIEAGRNDMVVLLLTLQEYAVDISLDGLGLFSVSYQLKGIVSYAPPFSLCFRSVAGETQVDNPLVDRERRKPSQLRDSRDIVRQLGSKKK